MKLEDRIKNLTTQQTIIATFVIAAAYFFLVFDGGGRIDDQIKKSKKDFKTKEQTLINTEMAMQNAAKFQEEVRRTNARFKEMLEFIPVDFSIADFMQLLSTEAESSGNKVVQIQPRLTDQEPALYEELLVELTIEGTYSQILTFLSRLTKINRIINMGGIRLSTIEADPISPVLRFQTVVYGYRYNIESQASSDGGDGN